MKYEGHLDYIERYKGKLFASGWVWNIDKPDETVNVDIMLDDKRIATADACMKREDLVNAGKGDGRHAFKRVYLDSDLTNKQIKGLKLLPHGSDKTIKQGPCDLYDLEGLEYEGKITSVEIIGPISRVKGWLWMPNQPGIRIGAKLMLDDKEAGRITADREVNGFSSGSHEHAGDHWFTTVLDYRLNKNQAVNLRLLPGNLAQPLPQAGDCKVIILPDKHPETRRLILDEAQRLIKTAQLDKAVTLFRKMLLINPDDQELNQQLYNTLYYQAGNDKVAKAKHEIQVFNLFLQELEEQSGALQ
jgi:hypothetical protein